MRFEMRASMVTSTYTSVRRYRLLGSGQSALMGSIGYYVHTCQKMKYKGDYSPSYLLDPVRLASPTSFVVNGK